MSTRVLCVHVLFLMFGAPIGEELCEGEEIEEYYRMNAARVKKKEGPACDNKNWKLVNQSL